MDRPQTQCDWFEIISENFMDTEGYPLHVLDTIRQDYPIGMHGVSMNLAGTDPLNRDYLKKLRDLIQRVEPVRFSDHLCWTGLAHSNTHNLLPFPYTEENLRFLVGKISYVQDYFNRQILIENLSAYLDFKQEDFTEWDFFNQLAKQSGCGLLLDINNIYVNAVNRGFDAKAFIDGIDFSLVHEIHLAGFSDFGTHLFDTHSKPVYPEVWELYRYAINQSTKELAVIVEWDEDIPEFNRLEKEVIKAREIGTGING
jgi:uncharacterized protein (UPF0276 family)